MIEAAKEPASLKNTFNKSLSKPKSWGNIMDAVQAAGEAGYPYIAWNGRVYEVTRSGDRFSLASLDPHVCFEDELT
jgi:hypothetical protein